MAFVLSQAARLPVLTVINALVIGAVIGGGAGLSAVLYPLVLLMAAMFHTSIWFSVRDSFQAEGSDPPASSNP